MQPNQVQEIVSRIISDEVFAAAVAAEPEKALKEAGVEPTLDVLEALKGLDKASIQRLAMAFIQ